MRSLALLVLIFLISSCAQKGETLSRAQNYFNLYADRSDWSAFTNQFSDKLKFEDVILGLQKNKEEFITFYNWPDTLFSKHPDYSKTLVLEDLAIVDNRAVGRGYFNPFYYGGVLMANDQPWRFTIWLKFNAQGQIIEQTDWIEYPPQFLK